VLDPTRLLLTGVVTGMVTEAVAGMIAGMAAGTAIAFFPFLVAFGFFVLLKAGSKSGVYGTLASLPVSLGPSADFFERTSFAA